MKAEGDPVDILRRGGWPKLIWSPVNSRPRESRRSHMNKNRAKWLLFCVWRPEARAAIEIAEHRSQNVDSSRGCWQKNLSYSGGRRRSD